MKRFLLLFLLIIFSENARAEAFWSLGLGYGQGTADLGGDYAASFIPIFSALEYQFVDSGLSLGLSTYYGFNYYRVSGTKKEGELTTYGATLGISFGAFRVTTEYLFSTELYAKSDRTISVNGEPFRRNVFTRFRGTSGYGVSLSWDLFRTKKPFSKKNKLRTSWSLSMLAPAFSSRADRVVITRPTHDKKTNTTEETGDFAMALFFLSVSMGVSI